MFIWSVVCPLRPNINPPFRSGSLFKLLLSVLRSGAFGAVRVAVGGVVVDVPVFGWWSVTDGVALLASMVPGNAACWLLDPMFVLFRALSSSFSKKDIIWARIISGSATLCLFNHCDIFACVMPNLLLRVFCQIAWR